MYSYIQVSANDEMFLKGLSDNLEELWSQ